MEYMAFNPDPGFPQNILNKPVINYPVNIFLALLLMLKLLFVLFFSQTKQLLV
jgi:hypothetical protein